MADPGILSGPRWIPPAPVPAEAIASLVSELGISPVLAELLVRRKAGDPETAKSFLRPQLSDLHPPERLPDLAVAAERLERAARSGETVLVHGDYDADGVCATALLTRGLRQLGIRAAGFVPHRTRDGYDFGDAGLAEAERLSAGLVVTVDCGILALEAVERARGVGLDVIVTDHHRPGPRLPDATAVVNPGRADSAYPFPGLCGTAVAFKLFAGLARRAGRPEEEINQHLDLVALATVADLVPLTGENRVLARYGLRVMERTRKPGLTALLATSGVGPGEEVTAAELGYRLGPRLNSAGRLDDAGDALQLLLTEDPAEAGILAGRLEALNRRRRSLDERVLGEAVARLEASYDPARDRAVVLWGEGWHPGVIGIVASRIVDRIHRPTVLVALDGTKGRGSARSIPGFHLFRALTECEDLLERFGGHGMAAGLDIRRSQLEEFTLRLQGVAEEWLEEEQLAPSLSLDLRLDLEEADEGLYRELGYLAPFGNGNPRPRLESRSVRVEGAHRVGGTGRHLRATLRTDSGGSLGAIGFGLGTRLEELAGHPRWDVAYELTENRWRGRRQLQARLLDLRPASGDGVRRGG